MSAEYITIANCPRCKGPHRYRLEVERAWVTKLATPFQGSEQPRVVRLTRLFTCPATGTDFEATFTLRDTAENRIKKVSVAGQAGTDERD